MNRKRATIVALGFLFCGSWVMGQSSHWLHVKVETAGENGEQVKLNLPMGLIEAALPILEANEVTKGKVHLSDLPMTVPQMREVWQTLKEEGDFELASIQDGGSDVRIFKEGNYLHIRTTEDAEEQVEVNIPARVVDALLSGEGEELNIIAAAKALAESDEGDLVSVKDGDETVRVWVDTSNTSE